MVDVGPTRTVLVSATARWLCCSIVALTGPCWLITPAAGTVAAHTAPAAGLQVKTDLEEETGLTVTIDNLRPAALNLSPREELTVSGAVINDGRIDWRDAQVYLDVATDPATTRPELTAFANSDLVVGTRIIEIGLFAELGRVAPGDSVSYSLTVPFDRLSISGIPGAYHLGVTVVAQNEDAVRREVARTDTLMPLLPRKDSRVQPTTVVTLIPLTAPVLRQRDGTFLNDSLVEDLSTGGRLRNVLDFAAKAPPQSLHLVLDPALHNAARAMANGYVVRTVAEAARGDSGWPGRGQREASDWLAQLDDVAAAQQLSLMVWGTPDASGLATHQMSGVVEAAVSATQRYADRHNLNEALIGWQTNGASTRRGLSVTRTAGTSVQVVAEESLVRLTGLDTYPPALVSLPTRSGPLTTLVARSDVAGEPLRADTTTLQFRQYLLAEATVRSLINEPEARHAVFAVPFHWDPGLAAGNVDLEQAYTYPAVEPQTGDEVAAIEPTAYVGPVRAADNAPPLSTGVLSAIAKLRDKGRILTGMRNDARATANFHEQLGLAGSSAWRWRPKLGESLIRNQAERLAKQIAKVSVTGPTFVALSSKTGRFPLTVTNGLKVPITVRLKVEPQNPALQIDPMEAVELEGGQRRDVQVTSRTEGSGVTLVRVRLSTPNDRQFGSVWSFNVRATQFGLVIWIAMGAGAAILFGAAAMRIYSRIRLSRAAPRSEPAAS